MKGAALFLAGLLAAGAGAAQHSPYAGQEGRAISSLSAEDVAALRAGEGWGLAKPAELNGWPGPRHALDLAAELELTPGQVAALEAQFAAMRAEAIRTGEAYLAAEEALDAAFRSGAAEPGEVARLAAEAGRTLAAVRSAHLTAHLETRAVLSAAQVEEYARLRGYGDAPAHEAGGHGHP